jgi:hypothetical protein
MIEKGDIEISVPRLLMSAIKSNNKLNINLSDYTDENLDNHEIVMDFYEDTNEFVLTLIEKENNE